MWQNGGVDYYKRNGSDIFEKLRENLCLNFYYIYFSIFKELDYILEKKITKSHNGSAFSLQFLHLQMFQKSSQVMVEYIGGNLNITNFTFGEQIFGFWLVFWIIRIYNECWMQIPYFFLKYHSNVGFEHEPCW